METIWKARIYITDTFSPLFLRDKEFVCLPVCAFVQAVVDKTLRKVEEQRVGENLSSSYICANSLSCFRQIKTNDYLTEKNYLCRYN